MGVQPLESIPLQVRGIRWELPIPPVVEAVRILLVLLVRVMGWELLPDAGSDRRNHRIGVFLVRLVSVPVE